MPHEDYPWDAYSPNSPMDMDYLLSEAGETRSVLAAHFVRHCNHVIEIGGYKMPITKYLTSVPQSVLVIDPKVDPFSATSLYGKPCKVDHIAERFQNIEIQPRDGGYGFVLLGCSLKFPHADRRELDTYWHKLVALIDGAEVAVLEYGLDWPLGAENAALILRRTASAVRLSVDLDLGRNDGMHPQFYRRRFLVLKPPDRA